MVEGPAPRNPALEAAILAEPESVDAWLVYGDWLLEQGDPLAELVTIQAARAKKPNNLALKKRERALLRDRERELLGPFADYEHTWSLGFVESVVLTDPTPEIYGTLLDWVAMRFLRILEIELSRDDAGARKGESNDAIVDAVVQRGLPIALRELRLVRRGGARGVSLGSLAPVWPRCDRLTCLEIAAEALDLGRIELPRLERLGLVTRPSLEAVRSLTGASVPRLRELSLGWMGAGDVPVSRCELLFEELGRGRTVRSLAIVDHRVGDRLVESLFRSSVLPSLASLSLSRSGLSDEGATELLRRRAAFAHLERLDLRDNPLSPALREALEHGFGGRVDLRDAAKAREDPLRGIPRLLRTRLLR